MSINPEDYKLLFRISDYKASCLLSELLLRGSLRIVDPLAVNKEGWWAFYARSSKLEDAGIKGFEILSNPQIFNKYCSEFDKNLSYSKENIIPRYFDKKIDSLTKNEFKILFSHLSDFWKLYGYTEYIFTDYAYKKANESSNSNNLLKDNIKKIGEIKNNARSYWQKYASENGILKNIFSYLDNKYYSNEDTAKYLNSTEISDILKGAKALKFSVSDRKKYYLIKLNIFKKIKFESLTSSRVLADKLHSLDMDEIHSSSGSLKGVVACQGKATGKAFIVPMFNKEDALEAAKKINIGDILIAQSTNPDLIVMMKKAGAIVTDQGGLLSHAAIISRELGIPCIVGTRNATKVFKNGDLIEVDAINGSVIKKE